jgi:hypothetical protein
MIAKNMKAEGVALTREILEEKLDNLPNTPADG